ncbi:hypothetical protein ANO11243_067630 [Dothideomycetidae sp. 11243]|nr:hypothetical protein ANO11243_067630 [fungal sp. No.11243]
MHSPTIPGDGLYPTFFVAIEPVERSTAENEVVFAWEGVTTSGSGTRAPTLCPGIVWPTGMSISNPSASAAAQSAVPIGRKYVQYSGDGTIAARWPDESEWVEFDDMWDLNTPLIAESCQQWDVYDNSDDETAWLKEAISQIAEDANVDPRFILAIVMQESKGCVRVNVKITTGAGSNPGLMQSAAGIGTCNGEPRDGCTYEAIEQMIRDGTQGVNSSLPGPVNCLVTALAWTRAEDVSRYYKAARLYNSGLYDHILDDLQQGCCTHCYASDVANRLRGWTTLPSSCTFDSQA